MRRPIDDFIAALTRHPTTATVANPYRDPTLAGNLRRYLQAMSNMTGKRILLVGEAPGYKGCKLTGIPFSSGKIFQQCKHPLLKELAAQIRLDTVESENTATIVWEYLSRKRTTPLFWNAFPFHPHLPGNPCSNRAPTAAEIEAGISHLQRLHDLYQPDFIAGIGAKGVCSAQTAFPQQEVMAIRHPSYGGKADFIAGMNKLMRKKRTP